MVLVDGDYEQDEANEEQGNAGPSLCVSKNVEIAKIQSLLFYHFENMANVIKSQNYHSFIIKYMIHPELFISTSIFKLVLLQCKQKNQRGR